MRTRNRNKIGIGLCLCAAAVTMGCGEGTDFGRLAGGDSGIGFEVSLAGEGEGVATRSTLGTKSFEGGASEGKTFRLRTTVTENRENPFASMAKSRATEITNENLFDSFGVYAYAYDSKESWSTASDYSLYIDDDVVTLSGSYWGFNPARYWPTAYKLTFFAYAPTALDESGSGSTDGSFAVSLDESDKLPQISYTVPSGYANQKDLVVATATDQTESASSVPLTFEHILTAVQVKCGSFSGGTISSVSISGVKGAGTYDMAKGVWSLGDKTTDYEVDGTFAVKDNAEILTDGYTLMLLPQKLEKDATIKLTYTPTGGDPIILTAGLYQSQEDLTEAGKQQEWEMGKKVTYVISYSADIDFNGHEGVDLGLSVIWATCNVGAEVPADYGTYFAWGEIAPPANGNYSQANCRLYGQTEYTYTDATGNDVTIEVTEDNIKGNPEFDAATANWGEPWRMPTQAEIEELISYCTSTWTSLDGVNGLEVKEPNGKSIFLPAAGYYSENSSTLTSKGASGLYWSCTLHGVNTMYARDLYFKSGSITSDDRDNRLRGFSVRPVRPK